MVKIFFHLFLVKISILSQNFPIILQRNGKYIVFFLLLCYFKKFQFKHGSLEWFFYLKITNDMLVTLQILANQRIAVGHKLWWVGASSEKKARHYPAVFRYEMDNSIM